MAWEDIKHNIEYLLEPYLANKLIKIIQELHNMSEEQVYKLLNIIEDYGSTKYRNGYHDGYEGGAGHRIGD